MTNKQPPPWEVLIHLLQRKREEDVITPFDRPGQLSRQAETSVTWACQDHRDHVALFVTDEMMGHNVDALYPELAHHLDVCEACLMAYVDLADFTHRVWLAGGDA